MPDVARTEAALRHRIAQHVDRMIDVRRELHAHPELSFEERRTTALVRDELAACGATLLPCPTPTGAVAVLEGGRPGRTVLLRADIDALPVEEDTGLAFASRESGCMHACGHDAHTAILLAVAEALSSALEDLPGRYVLVFQPAEEIVSGAQAMVDGGMLTGLDPAAAIGLHVVSHVPCGSVLARPGLSMAGSQGLRISLTSTGGHGALQPRRGNVVLAAAEIATRLHTVVEGVQCEGTDGVCSPGLISSGTAFNVVPTRAELGATLRWFDRRDQDESMRRVHALVADVEEDFGVSGAIAVEFGTGPVRNDPGVTATVLAAARQSLPGSTVVEMDAPVAASDDVSVLLDLVPGCYMMLGAALDDGNPRRHHTPTFAIDERALVVGATALGTSAIALAGVDEHGATAGPGASARD